MFISFKMMPIMNDIPIKCKAAKTHLSAIPLRLSFLKFMIINVGTKMKQKQLAPHKRRTPAPGRSNVMSTHPTNNNKEEMSPTINAIRWIIA